MPNSKKLEFLVLGTATAAAVYNYSSEPTLVACFAAWNLVGKLAMHRVSKSNYEHILIKIMDVPVNIATTTMFSGLTPLFSGFELAPKFARALAYGVFGEIIKDFSDTVAGLNIEKPSLVGYFAIQSVKYILTPLNYSGSWQNLLEYCLAGGFRNMTNEIVRGNTPWNIDAIAMGATAYTAFYVLASACNVTSMPQRLVLGIGLDCAERILYHLSNKPITALLNAVSGNSSLKRD